MALELAVLNAIGSCLDSDSSGRVRKQLAQVRLVQRLNGGCETNCYPGLGRGSQWDADTLFASDRDEKLLATFEFRSVDGVKFTGKAWIVAGHIFSLEFDRPTEHILEEEPQDLRVQLTRESRA